MLATGILRRAKYIRRRADAAMAWLLRAAQVVGEGQRPSLEPRVARDFEPLIQVAAALGAQLRHEEADQFFLGVDEVLGEIGAAPAVRALAAELAVAAGVVVDPEAQTEGFGLSFEKVTGV